MVAYIYTHIMYAEYKNGMREGKGKGEKEYNPIGNVSTHKGLRSFELVLDKFQCIFDCSYRYTNTKPNTNHTRTDKTTTDCLTD